MLCSKCHKEIEPGKEIHIEGLKVCKNCAEKITIDCYTCDDKIPYNKPVHKSSRNWNKGFNIWLFFANEGNSEEVNQCNKCYRAWKGRMERWEKLRKATNWLIGVCISILLCWCFELFYPEQFKKVENSTPFAFIIVMFAAYIIFLFIGIFVEIGRYRDMREARRKKEEKNKTKNRNKKIINDRQVKRKGTS